MRPPNEPGPRTEALAQSLSEATNGSHHNRSIPELLNAIQRGHYRPSPDSAGAVLLEAHPSTDPYTAGRILAIFARVALRRQGLWWLMALEAYEDRLSTFESDYMARCWREWCAGSNPFQGGRRVAA